MRFYLILLVILVLVRFIKGCIEVVKTLGRASYARKCR